MPAGRTRTPPILRRCVADVMAKKDGATTQSAFAICVASLQKHGTLKPGSIALTKKGKTHQRSRVAQPDHKQKMRDYEKHLKRARTTEESLVLETVGIVGLVRSLLEA